jgi:hypothetical protein
MHTFMPGSRALRESHCSRSLAIAQLKLGTLRPTLSLYRVKSLACGGSGRLVGFETTTRKFLVCRVTDDEPCPERGRFVIKSRTLFEQPAKPPKRAKSMRACR